MAKRYASEREALGICDRCGLTYPLRALIREFENRNVTNLRVCKDCKDGEHPQDRLGELRTDDPISLRNPRPDSSKQKARTGDSIVYDFDTDVESFVASRGDLSWTSAGKIALSNPVSTYSGDTKMSIGRTASSTPLIVDTSEGFKHVRIGVDITTEHKDLDWAGVLAWSGDGDPDIAFTSATPFLNPSNGALVLIEVVTPAPHGLVEGDYVIFVRYTGGFISTDPNPLGTALKVGLVPTTTTFRVMDPVTGEIPAEAWSASGGTGIFVKAYAKTACRPNALQFGEQVHDTHYDMRKESGWTGIIDSALFYPVNQPGHSMDISYIKFEKW